MKDIINKAIWYLKQLLPLTYTSIYTEGEQKKLSVWKMFLGKCYNIKVYNLK